MLALAQKADRGLLAVLYFRSKLADKGELDAGYFADRVRADALRALPGVRVITRENLIVLLQNSGKQLDDCEGECEVDTGRRIGADLVVSGDVLKVGQSYKLNLRLHETHEGRLLNGAVASGKTVDELDANAAAAVQELLQPLREQPSLARRTPVPPAALESPRHGNPALRRAGYVSGGAGLLFALGAGYFALRSRSLVNDVRNGDAATGTELADKASQSVTANKFAWGFLAVAVVALGAGATLVLLNPAEPP